MTLKMGFEFNSELKTHLTDIDLPQADATHLLRGV